MGILTENEYSKQITTTKAVLLPLQCTENEITEELEYTYNVFQISDLETMYERVA